MLKGSTPVRLSQIDMSPFVRAAKMNEAASVNLSNSVGKAIQRFTKKEKERKLKVGAIDTIMEMLGVDKKTATAIHNDENVRDAFNMQQKAEANKARTDRELEELKILKGNQARLERDRKILEEAIAVSTTPSGRVDMSSVKSAFVELGGRNPSVYKDLMGPGEIKISNKGVITQDGAYKGTISSKALDIPKTQAEIDQEAADLEAKKAKTAKTKTETLLLEADLEGNNLVKEYASFEDVPDDVEGIVIVDGVKYDTAAIKNR